MARSIVSFGMFPALASLTALRRRGFWFGSPLPPERAAIVISLIHLVKSFPRLASSAPFLCLIVCHFECPDIGLIPSVCFSSIGLLVCSAYCLWAVYLYMIV